MSKQLITIRSSLSQLVNLIQQAFPFPCLELLHCITGKASESWSQDMAIQYLKEHCTTRLSNLKLHLGF